MTDVIVDKTANQVTIVTSNQVYKYIYRNLSKDNNLTVPKYVLNVNNEDMKNIKVTLPQATTNLIVIP